MVTDETALSQKYELVKLSVAGGTQISSRSAAIISKLSNPPSEGERPVIIVLVAKSRSANKLISIVEIAKRDLLSKAVKCFQYNALSSEMVEIERKGKGQANDSAGGAADKVAEESDDAFEAMNDKNGIGPKKRLVPIMMTYLSSSEIKELKVYR